MPSGLRDYNSPGTPSGSFEAGIRVPGKAHRGNGKERKQQQYDPISGIVHCESPIRLEQERREDQTSHYAHKYAD